MHILGRRTSGMPVSAWDEVEEACFGQLSAPCYLGNALACRTYVYTRAGWILHPWQLFPRRRTCEQGRFRFLCRFHVRHCGANTSSSSPIVKATPSPKRVNTCKNTILFLRRIRTKEAKGETSDRRCDGAWTAEDGGPWMDRCGSDPNTVLTRSSLGMAQPPEGADLDLAFSTSHLLNPSINKGEPILAGTASPSKPSASIRLGT